LAAQERLLARRDKLRKFISAALSTLPDALRVRFEAARLELDEANQALEQARASQAAHEHTARPKRAADVSAYASRTRELDDALALHEEIAASALESFGEVEREVDERITQVLCRERDGFQIRINSRREILRAELSELGDESALISNFLLKLGSKGSRILSDENRWF
jgi:hypothetical protein